MRRMSHYHGNENKKRQHYTEQVKNGELELCFQRVFGLWYILGREGFFFQKYKPEGVKAYNRDKNEILNLVPATDEEVCEYIAREAEGGAYEGSRLKKE